MPLRIPYDAVNSQSGSVTQVLIAQQLNFRTRITTSAGDAASTDNGFYKHQPGVNTIDLARAGTTIPVNILDGTAQQTQDAAGPIDITNGLVIALAGNGTGLMLQMITQDNEPDWYIYGGNTGDQTYPGEVNVVAATAALEDTEGSATIADSLSSTTSPVRLNFSTSSTASLNTGSSRGLVIFEGTDDEDTAITETFAFPNPSGENEITSNLWYKTVTDVKTSGWDKASGKTYGVTATDRSTEVVFTPQDVDLVVFWTVYVSKGIIPNVYDGVIVENTTIDITRDGLIQFACTVLGRQARLYTNLAGETTQTSPARTYPARTAMQTTGDNALQIAKSDIYSGLQTTITGENSDIEMSATDATVTINQELEYVNVMGSRFQITKPARGNKRLFQLESTQVFSPGNNYSTYFESNQPMPNVRIIWKASGYGAYPYELVLEIPFMQLTADPDPAVTDFGTIYQNVVMKAVSDKSGRFPYDYRFIARYSDYVQVMTYTIA